MMYLASGDSFEARSVEVDDSSHKPNALNEKGSPRFDLRADLSFPLPRDLKEKLR